MLELDRILPYLLLAFLSALFLMWAQRSLVQEFGYPREFPLTDIEGVPSLVAVYIVSGWLFGYAAFFITVPGGSPANIVGTFALIGVIFAGALRLHALSRSVSRGTSLPAPLTESALVFLALGLAGAVMITGVGRLNEILANLAPTSPPHYLNPQPFSVLILISAMAVCTFVELVWNAYRQSTGYQELAAEIARGAVDAALRNREGVAALNFYLTVSATPGTFTQRSRRTRNFRTITKILADEGLLVPVPSGGFRRHPHFHKAHRDRVSAALQSLAYTEVVSATQLEALLSRRTIDASLIAIPRLPGERLESAVSIDWLLDEALSDMENALTGRQAVFATYLRERYWEGRKVSEVAARLGYSREHLARMAHRPALDIFRRFLYRRLSGLDTQEPGEMPAKVSADD